MLIESLNEGHRAWFPRARAPGKSRGLSTHRIGSVPSFRIATIRDSVNRDFFIGLPSGTKSLREKNRRRVDENDLGGAARTRVSTQVQNETKPRGPGIFSAPSDYDCGAIAVQSFVLLGSAVLPLDYPIENATVVGVHECLPETVRPNERPMIAGSK